MERTVLIIGVHGRVLGVFVRHARPQDVLMRCILDPDVADAGSHEVEQDGSARGECIVKHQACQQSRRRSMQRPRAETIRLATGFAHVEVQRAKVITGFGLGEIQVGAKSPIVAKSLRPLDLRVVHVHAEIKALARGRGIATDLGERGLNDAEFPKVPSKRLRTDVEAATVLEGKRRVLRAERQAQVARDRFPGHRRRIDRGRPLASGRGAAQPRDIPVGGKAAKRSRQAQRQALSLEPIRKDRRRQPRQQESGRPGKSIYASRLSAPPAGLRRSPSSASGQPARPDSVSVHPL